MSGISLRLANDADRSVMEHLWLMFRHDLSEFGGQLPRPDGTFRSEWLQAAFTDPDWAPYLLLSGEHPVGLALVRGLGGHTRVLNGFFVVRGARRSGIGIRAVQEVVAKHPGPWEVAFQDANVGAVSFWRRVAAEIAGDGWAEDRRPVPGRPDLPPDVWISFDVRA
ncbi:GNAT family N-acetyltransferase [Streptomyces subrutilus]|uniref:GNAT family N-acetyltransferase n=1 Tax=Streptomyces subrutilus TaxID=36818 RepID=A0A1E5Q051_9ACTN|nr:GNAT family N-acetyltransferase [Streptomyces subrutilus]OEJ35177.1 GNAT family N-acetyltransferase [Streptomyces subrutilus]